MTEIEYEEFVKSCKNHHDNLVKGIGLRRPDHDQLIADGWIFEFDCGACYTSNYTKKINEQTHVKYKHHYCGGNDKGGYYGWIEYIKEQHIPIFTITTGTLINDKRK